MVDERDLGQAQPVALDRRGLERVAPPRERAGGEVEASDAGHGLALGLALHGDVQGLAVGGAGDALDALLAQLGGVGRRQRDFALNGARGVHLDELVARAGLALDAQPEAALRLVPQALDVVGGLLPIRRHGHLGDDARGLTAGVDGEDARVAVGGVRGGVQDAGASGCRQRAERAPRDAVGRRDLRVVGCSLVEAENLDAGADADRRVVGLRRHDEKPALGDGQQPLGARQRRQHLQEPRFGRVAQAVDVHEVAALGADERVALPAVGGDGEAFGFGALLGGAALGPVAVGDRGQLEAVAGVPDDLAGA